MSNPTSYPRPRDRQVVTYRLGQSTPLSQSECSRLTAVWEVFAQSATSQLGPFLRCNFQFNAVNFHCRSYRSYLNEFQGDRPALNFMLDQDSGGCFIVELDALLGIVERMLGGQGQRPPARVKGYTTEVESHLLAQVMRGLLASYYEAWQPYQGPKPRFGNSYIEFNPYLALLCSMADTVLVSTFQLRTPHFESCIDILLPWDLVHRRLGVAAPQVTSTQAGPSLRWQSQQVEVSLHMGCGEVLFGELLGLQVGDVIKLDSPVREPLEVRVNGTAKFKAYPGVRGRNLGARVCEVLQEPIEDD